MKLDVAKLDSAKLVAVCDMSFAKDLAAIEASVDLAVGYCPLLIEPCDSCFAECLTYAAKEKLHWAACKLGNIWNHGGFC